jgi:hypothetical protein
VEEKDVSNQELKGTVLGLCESKGQLPTHSGWKMKTGCRIGQQWAAIGSIDWVALGTIGQQWAAMGNNWAAMLVRQPIVMHMPSPAASLTRSKSLGAAWCQDK